MIRRVDFRGIGIELEVVGEDGVTKVEAEVEITGKVEDEIWASKTDKESWSGKLEFEGRIDKFWAGKVELGVVRD